MSTNLTAAPFVDEVEIYVRAGHGGAGMVHFHREKFIPKGGPDGGDGGKGGDVIFIASTHVNTLNWFRTQRRILAENGKPGFVKNQTGASGADTEIAVPVGTLFYNCATGELMYDLKTPGERWIAAHGGKGGLGNWHFKNSRNQAPRYAQPGLPGEEFHLRLELRLLADVALIGYPNAGKSSTIRAISRARPKVADYPFTTLVPHLGVVDDGGGDGYVVADLPGLIEGASEGAGLGHQFLKHVSRSRLLVHVLDLAAGSSVASLVKRHRAIMRELKRAPVKIQAPVALATFNKADLLTARDRQGVAAAFTKQTKLPVIWTSTATGEGIAQLKAELARRLGLIAKEHAKRPMQAKRKSKTTSKAGKNITTALARPSAVDRIWGAI